MDPEWMSGPREEVWVLELRSESWVGPRMEVWIQDGGLSPNRGLSPRWRSGPRMEEWVLDGDLVQDGVCNC